MRLNPLKFRESVCLLSRVWLFVTPWTAAHQVPLSMRFSRQEYWSRLPCPSPGHLPNPRVEPDSPAFAGGFFTTEPPRKPLGRLKESQILEKSVSSRDSDIFLVIKVSRKHEAKSLSDLDDKSGNRGWVQSRGIPRGVHLAFVLELHSIQYHLLQPLGLLPTLPSFLQTLVLIYVSQLYPWLYIVFYYPHLSTYANRCLLDQVIIPWAE